MEHPTCDLRNTAFFPLTGNPTGFHHLLLAECVLRQFPEIQRIVFILSNGKHPDPTKEQAIVNKQTRLEILEKALQEFNDPQSSCVAKMAQQSQKPLQFNAQNTSISTAEFTQDQPVRLYEHLKTLQQQTVPASISYPLMLIIGGDLIQRMSSPEIFSDADLQELAKHCRFLAAPRGEYETEKTLSQLEETRQVSLNHQTIQIEQLPAALHPFLELSSTIIRQMVQAQHALTCCLPDGAAKMIHHHQLYQERTITREENEWQHQCYLQEQQLDQRARQLQKVLDWRADQNLAHTLAIVETSTGGQLATTLASLPGISRHFKESTVVYDQAAKNRLLGQAVEKSSVSPAMATELAKKYHQQTGADFVLSETGMAGPLEGVRRSNKQGLCYFAVATPTTIQNFSHQSNPFFSKKEHQFIFAIVLLESFIQLLKNQ